MSAKVLEQVPAAVSRRKQEDESNAEVYVFESTRKLLALLRFVANLQSSQLAARRRFQQMLALHSLESLPGPVSPGDRRLALETSRSHLLNEAIGVGDQVNPAGANIVETHGTAQGGR